MNDIRLLIWRFWNGKISGIVIAESEDEARERAAYYLSVQFNDIKNEGDTELCVWQMCKDDDFREDYPFALAVSY